MGDSDPDVEDGWVDWDENTPEWTDEMLDAAELKIGDRVIRAATGYIGPNGFVRGVPPTRGRDEPQG